MPTIEEMVAFVSYQTKYDGPFTEETTLQTDIGVYGDDMSEFLALYKDRFGVDMSSYLWYFHTGEEGMSLGGLIFPPPNKQVQGIPITIKMLCDFAELGRWNVDYPEHEKPTARPDIRINQGCFFITLIPFLFFLIQRGCGN